MTKTIPTEPETMAWMSVADAATVLGVPERTILKRVKAKTIESRKDHGRTMVRIEVPKPDNASTRELSTIEDAEMAGFTGTELSMRKLNAGAVSEVLAVLSEYRVSCDEEIARSRRTTRWVGAVAVGLLIAIGACVWYYTTTLGEIRYEHAVAVSNLNSAHQEALGQYREQAARADGLSTARAAEIETLQQIENKHQEQFAVVETSRNRLQDTIDERLTGFQTITAAQQALYKSFQQTMNERLAETNATIAAQQAAVETREEKLAQLQKSIEKLQADLHEKELELRNEELVFQAVQKQSGKINEAIRRSAARSIGMAEGLRLNINQQQEMIQRLREELAESQTAREAAIALEASGPTRNGDEVEVENARMRQLLWDSLIDSTAEHGGTSDDAGIENGGVKRDGMDPPVGKTQSSVSSTTSPWTDVLESCFRLWLFGPSDSAKLPKRDRFAQAE